MNRIMSGEENHVLHFKYQERHKTFLKIMPKTLFATLYKRVKIKIIILCLNYVQMLKGEVSTYKSLKKSDSEESLSVFYSCTSLE